MKNRLVAGFICGALLFGTVGVFAGQYVATENPFPIQLNGQSIDLEGYNINDNTYFKLRDIADVIGGFTVDFQNNTIRLSKDGYVYGDTSSHEDLLLTMTDAERHTINMFLSNFSEVDFGNFNINQVNRDQLIYFGCLHNARNHTAAAIPISDEEAKMYVNIDNDYIHSFYKVSAEAVNNSISRYIGTEVSHGDASYLNVIPWNFGYFNGDYYFDAGEEGDAGGVFTVADAMYDNKDGTYTVEFTEYSSGYPEVVSSYAYSPESVANEKRANKGVSGTALVKPFTYNGSDTYQLIKLSY